MTKRFPLRAGTQSIERAVRVMKELVARGSVGWRLLDLAERCELEHATTHRLLATLQEPDTKMRRYRPSEIRTESQKG